MTKMPQKGYQGEYYWLHLCEIYPDASQGPNGLTTSLIKLGSFLK